GKLPVGNSYLDSLGNSLKFLEGKGELLGASKGKLAGVTGNIESLQGKLQQAEQIKAYIREHKKQLKEQLSQYTGFTKDLQKINKEAYYYGQQINEYKSVLKDKKKAEAKAMELLKKMPAYNDFLRKNSQIASLFNLGASGNNTAQSLEGLQTRTQRSPLFGEALAHELLGHALGWAMGTLNFHGEKAIQMSNVYLRSQRIGKDLYRNGALHGAHGFVEEKMAKDIPEYLESAKQALNLIRFFK
ncbi:hypothetical protein SAMN05216311_1201, partial [Chitinophaga sp. CF418]